jgi:hypothetical protein
MAVLEHAPQRQYRRSSTYSFRIIMPTKGFGLHIYLQDQYPIPFPFPHCEKLALFYNLNFT